MRKFPVLIVFLVLALFLVWGGAVASAEADKVVVTVFTSQGCPHCATEIAFLRELSLTDPQLEVRQLETSSSAENVALLRAIGQEMKVSIGSVPLTIVGNKYLSGFGTAETTGVKIKAMIELCRSEPCPDRIAEIMAVPNSSPALTPAPTPATEDSAVVAVPLLGEIDPANVSLFLVTVVLAALDGFNPCAMWVLLFLITLLLGLGDRRKMWFLGIVFLSASAVAYFLFLVAWLNIFLFAGSIWWVKLLVGVFAVGAGVYYLWDFIVNRNASCRVTGQEQKTKIIGYFKKIIGLKSIWLAALGLVVLAFLVNLIELACSAGLPAVFSSILAQNDLPPYQYYLFLLLYIVIFLLDDIIVFSVAMLFMKVTGVSTKYRRVSSLVGGLIMLFIGLAIIFFPKLLTFG